MRPSKRDELVRKSLAVFYRDGFHATGMDTLVAETGISKTTMFKHFRTKDDLILAVLRYRDETFRNWFLRRLDERDISPRQKLLAVFDILKEWFEEPGFKGCMFIKASAEFQEPVHPAYAQSTEHKRLLLSALKSLAEKAGLARRICWHVRSSFSRRGQSLPLRWGSTRIRQARQRTRQRC